MQKVLVTGAAGFIGSHVCRKLLVRGDLVTGIDSLNSYYDPMLKQARLSRIGKDAGQVNWNFVRGDLADGRVVADLFAASRFDRVIHLAAQAGVRHSITHPHDYVQANIVAFTNILEACRHAGVPHLTYASTSSVYGASTALPFRENDGVGHPLQFYAATKRANELMAHSYSHLFSLPTTGLRFFTVYGPWGRPDMALFLFTKNIIEGKPIKLFNDGNHTRDFTYVEDIAEGVIRASDAVAAPDPSWNPANADIGTSNAPYRVFNIGNSTSVPLLGYIEAIEDALGAKAIKEYLPLQPGDVPDTWADAGRLEAAVGYRPTTPVKTGVKAFVDWYRDYYQV